MVFIRRETSWLPRTQSRCLKLLFAVIVCSYCSTHVKKNDFFSKLFMIIISDNNNKTLRIRK